ncbi:hypothetical protein PHMEG_00010413 [Phytophthora megakarya]|uniref:Uncharacterized protein n=1 Tax=Phytophthora megakarya TaxID=4795 RepID=A0A225WE42_9STRA|nr:hypothetical protein PHMEG_00010413 [Phytophthora megakarya]
MCINGVLDVSFCPDTGADINVISKTLAAGYWDLMLKLQSDPLNLRNVPCLVLDGRINESDGDDVTHNDAELKFAVDMKEIHSHLDLMIAEAAESGFDPALLEELRPLLYEYDGV